MKKILSVLVAVLLMTSLFAQSSSRILNDIRDGQIRGMLVKSRAHRAAAPGAPASKATYNLTMTSCQSNYFEEDGDWYFGMSDGNAQFYFDIYAENIVSGYTYTFSDMDDYYSYADIGGEEYDYTAASFTYTLNADGTEHISAMATLSTGDIYYLTYDTPAAADTVEVVVPSAMLVDLTASNAVFQMRGTTADQRTLASVAINTSQVAGSYVSSDFNAYYTYMGFISADATDTTYAEFVSGEATVTATATGYTLEAYVLCDNNHCYHITMRYATNGINTANQVQVNVYPNPADDMLHVEADGIVRIDVIDAAGRIVLSNTRNVNTLNISGLSNGVYMLRTATTEGVNIQKIVKK